LLLGQTTNGRHAVPAVRVQGLVMLRSLMLLLDLETMALNRIKMTRQSELRATHSSLSP
jgi:hypothetical protein